MILKNFGKARSSGGERYLDAVEVGGSIPPAPTIACFLSFPENFFKRHLFSPISKGKDAFFCFEQRDQ